MKIKNYEITENSVATTISATSQLKALAMHFGCERPVKCMSGRDWANRRWSKANRDGYRSATIRELIS